MPSGIRTYRFKLWSFTQKMSGLFVALIGNIWVFPKIVGFPSKSSILMEVFHYKPSILGYPYFWKHPSHNPTFAWKLWGCLTPPLLEPFKRGLGPNKHSCDIRCIWGSLLRCPHPKGFPTIFPMIQWIGCYCLIFRCAQEVKKIQLKLTPLKAPCTKKQVAKVASWIVLENLKTASSKNGWFSRVPCRVWIGCVCCFTVNLFCRFPTGWTAYVWGKT